MKNLILKVKKHIKKVLIVIGLVGVASAIVISTPTIPQEPPIGTIPLSISETIKDFSAVAKANYKSREIAKIGSISRVLHGKYEIEITGLNPIEGGVEFYVRAWDLTGNSISLGTGVETEHFRIFNPSINVEDPNGIIILEWTDRLTGELKQQKFREDLREALLQDVEPVINATRKKGIPKIGSVGNTTSIIYSDAGTGLTTVDGSLDKGSGTWAGARDATTSDSANPTTNADYIIAEYFEGSYRVWRHFNNFDTSVIGTDEISSVSQIRNFSDNHAPAGESLHIIETSSADNNNLVTTDFNNLTFTSWASIGIASLVEGDNTFSFNATGLAGINKTGITKTGAIWGYDLNNTSPPTDKRCYTLGFFADNTDSALRSRLVVVHSAAAGGAIPKIIISE